MIVAYGFEYLVMAINNARSIRVTNPGLAVTLVTNAPQHWTFLAEDFDRVIHRDEPDEVNRLAKIRCHAFTTAQRVLYIDADAEVLGDLTPAFRLLDDYDVLLRPFDLPSKFPHQLGPDLDGQLFPQFMGGIWFFRRTAATIGFLERWEQRYLTAGLARDQPALARAVHDAVDVRFLPMNGVWGSFSRAAASRTRPDPRIYHYADVSNDEAVLARCLGIVAELEGRIEPTDTAWREDVAVTARRLTRLASPWYRSPITNQIARRFWRWRDRSAGGSGIDTRKKQPRVLGSSLDSARGPLWSD